MMASLQDLPDDDDEIETQSLIAPLETALSEDSTVAGQSVTRMARLVTRIRGRKAYFILFGTLLTGIYMIQQQSSDLTMPDKLRMSQTASSSTSWVDGPPVRLNGSETLQSLMDQSRAIQAILPQEEIEQQLLVAQDPPPYPVIRDKDDEPPMLSLGTLHAAEALMCRKSVINFVINATDGKDECEGLKKAFDKTCTGGGGDEGPHGRQRRRTLWEKTNHFEKLQLFLYRHYRWLHRIERRFRSGSPLFFFSEDEVVLAYDDAQSLVNHNLDLSYHEDLRRLWVYESQERRHLEDGAAGAANKTVVKKPMSLSLPTSNQHLSDKQLSETLLIHQGDMIIEKAQNESKAKQEAVNDAKASSKAVADTNAAVSALLNDPTSIEARTCCASILNVYHENCSTDDEEQVSDSRLFFVVFVMALCGMVKSLIRHFKLVWLPEAAGCILVGVMSGYIIMFFPHHDLSFDGNWFLRVLVPPIVFEAALSIDKRSFNRHVVPIIIYAVAGTLFSTAVTAFVVHRGTTYLKRWCAPIPYVEALTFGALISSIDPIAVLSVLSNMGMTDTDTIYVVIFGESLLNDGVAIVLFHTLVHFLDENLVIDSQAVWSASVHFLIVAIGSLLVGVASGMMSTLYFWLFHGCQTPLVEVIMFTCWALLPYYVCDGIGWSGIVSAVATGFVMDLYIVGQKLDESLVTDDSETSAYSRNGDDRPADTQSQGRLSIFSPRGHLSAEARQHIGFVTEIIATTMETAIFAYLGLFLFSHRYHWNFFHGLIAILACCVSRGAMIPCLSFIANWVTRMQQHRAACRPQGRKGSNTPAGVVIDGKMQVILWFAGLRGAMSFALVEHIPLYDSVSGEGTRLKPELKAMTSASIMFTVFILGGYTYYVMDYLGLSPNAQAKRNASYEMSALINKTGSGEDRTEATTLPNNRSYEESKPRGFKNIFRRQRQLPRPSSGDQDAEDLQQF